MSKPLVLITGATGYLGGHIINQLIEDGYPVRMLARSSKVDAERKQFGNKVDVRPLASIAEDDFSEALQGVEVLVHVASPLVGREDPKSMVKSAREGSVNIIRQAIAAGVKRIVVTSSWVACVDASIENQAVSNHVYTDRDWNPMTYEDTISSQDPVLVYHGAKALSEREIWKIADENPEVDITTINPPYLYGPIPSGSFVTKESLLTYSTVARFYNEVLQNPGENLKIIDPQGRPPITLDVRDAARAHVLAITAPPSNQVGCKRIVVGGRNFTWKEAVEHLQKVRPELATAGRLRDASKAKIPNAMATIDGARAKEVLGLSEYIPWEKTVEDMVDSILEIEQAA